MSVISPRHVETIARMVELLAQKLKMTTVKFVDFSMRVESGHGFVSACPPGRMSIISLIIGGQFATADPEGRDMTADGGAIIAIGCQFDRNKTGCRNGGIIIDVPADECDLFIAALEAATSSPAVNSFQRFADYVDIVEDEKKKVAGGR